MISLHNGVAGFILHKQQSVFMHGCSCHRIHIAAQIAANNLLVKIDELLIDIYYYLEKSSKRQQELQNVKNCATVKCEKNTVTCKH